MKIFALSGYVLLLGALTGCELVKPFEPASIIHEDAHGGGSIVEFNAKETVLASGGWAGIIRLWVIPDGSASLQWQAHKDEITGIQFIAEDRKMVTASYDGSIRVWTSEGALLLSSQVMQPVRSMAVSEADNLVVTGHVGGFVRMWQLDSLKLIQSRQTRNSDIRAVAWSAKKQTVASSAFDGSVWLWPKEKQSIELEAPSSDARTLTFTQSGDTLLGGGWFHVFKWDLNAQKLTIIETEYAGIIRNMQLVENEQSLATISRQTDSAVLFIDPNTGVVQRRFQSHDLCGQDVTVSRNNRFMASTSDDASVRIWWLKSPNRTLNER
ncbi:MAG: hypothetical protein HOM11_01845 [Methylococcales bacterium]|nr:hypothetical protein [Methylococcales bacterium]